MNIIKASKVTGLTKKEIIFYQEEGLIEPEKNKKNGQRNYNDRDIQSIILIYALRIFGFDIDTIKKCMSDNKYFYECIKTFIQEIKNKMNFKSSVIEIIEKLEDEMYFNNNLEDIIVIANELEEYKMENDINYISYKFLNSFPGNYGKFLMLEYSQFLNVTLDNKEQKDSFRKILKYIDNLNNFKLNKNLDLALKGLNYDILLVLKDEKIRTIDNVISNNEIEIQKIKENILSFVELTQNNENVKKSFAKNKSKGKTLIECLKEKLYYNDFLTDMRKISDAYDRYSLAMSTIENELGIKYDENGIIYIDKK